MFSGVDVQILAFHVFVSGTINAKFYESRVLCVHTHAPSCAELSVSAWRAVRQGGV